MQDINYDKYFDMAVVIIDPSAVLEIRKPDGELLTSQVPVLQSDPQLRLAQHRAGSTERPFIELNSTNDKQRYAVCLHKSSAAVCGYLVATVDKGLMRAEIESGVHTLAQLIEEEIQLSSELDDMADELTSRYEELNLIYEETAHPNLSQYETDGFAHLIENCAAHMNVDLVALLIAQQEKTYYALDDVEAMPDPLNVLRSLQAQLTDYFTGADVGLIINKFNDTERSRLRIEEPYKILACGIKGTKGKLDGILLCLNRNSRRDFMNSDRSLLQVIASKIGKTLQSNYDDLTALLNRRAFEAHISAAIKDARGNGVVHAYVVVDLAQMQIHNETHGHEAGDAFIAWSANLLKAQLRANDAIGYLGDARFACIFEHCAEERAKHIVEKLRAALQVRNFDWNGKQINADAAFGVALIEPHTQHSSDVFAQADIALDAAKKHGRSRVRVFKNDEEEFAERKSQMQWANRVQAALRDNGFVLFAQQIAPAQPSAERYHLEILIRMPDPDGGFVSPGLFLPAAEQYNLMPDLDRWVIDQTLATLADMGLAQSRHEGVVSINLSGQSISDASLITYIHTKLNFYAVDPTCVCFEVTETVAIDSMHNAIAVLSAIQRQGCAISLDDFGTGLSSFSYLRELPLNYVKIDGSFVKTMLSDNVAKTMVSSINDVGHVMGLRTVAEFVENHAIEAALRDIGVDYLQGYGIAEPIPLTDYLAGLRSAAANARVKRK